MTSAKEILCAALSVHLPTSLSLKKVLSNFFQFTPCLSGPQLKQTHKAQRGKGLKEAFVTTLASCPVRTRLCQQGEKRAGRAGPGKCLSFNEIRADLQRKGLRTERPRGCESAPSGSSGLLAAPLGGSQRRRRTRLTRLKLPRGRHILGGRRHPQR